MQKPFSPKAVFFDYFGTLVQDDDIQIEEVCHRIVDSSPLPITTKEVESIWLGEFKRLWGKSYGDSFRLQREIERLAIRKVIQKCRSSLNPEELSQYMFDYWSNPKLCPETNDIINQCSLPICIVSNIDNIDIYSAFKGNGLSFENVITSEDCRSYKPRPELFLCALKKMNCSPEQVLFVGDSYANDVCGAKPLGMPVLWLDRRNHRHTVKDNPPDFISSDLKGVVEFLVPGF